MSRWEVQTGAWAFSPLKRSWHDVCSQVWVRKKLLWTVECTDQMLLYMFRWRRQYHGCKFSTKLSSAHQHCFYLVYLLSCFPSISWSYLSLGHGVSSHEVVYGEGWVEVPVIFWSCYCLLLMNFLCFIYLGKWKVPSLDSCQPCKMPLCSVLGFPILSSGTPLYHVGFCEWVLTSLSSNSRSQNHVSISYRSALTVSSLPSQLQSKTCKSSAVSIFIAYSSLTE